MAKILITQYLENEIYSDDTFVIVTSPDSDAPVIVYGTASADEITGGFTINHIYGGAGNDKIYGRGRIDDYLYGGEGDDYIEGSQIIPDSEISDPSLPWFRTTIEGGGGNDYIVGPAGRVFADLYGGDGDDYIVAGPGVAADENGDGRSEFMLFGEDGNDTLIGADYGMSYLNGGAGDNVLYGGNFNDHETILSEDGNDFIDAGDGISHSISSGGGNDVIYAGDDGYLWADAESGDDKIIGGGHGSRLEGGDGNDYLRSNSGNATLEGGADADIFSFALMGVANADQISDFEVGFDRIELNRLGGQSVFKRLPEGTLAETAFVLGTSAQDANDRVIYDASTGNLYYDADGTGFGAAQLFATVTANTVLQASDFFVA